MSALSNTSNAGAQSAAAVVVLNWLLNGHPAPGGQLPLDVAAVFVAWLALAGHTVQALGSVIVETWVKKHAPALEPAVDQLLPPNGVQP